MASRLKKHLPPKLFAHRGDPVHAPENTLRSFAQAAAKGARGVELDIRRTRDGVWIVFHDASLKRTTGGRGRVARKFWRDVSVLNAGGGESIPKLTDILTFALRRGLKLFLDLKISGGEESLLRVLRSSGCLARVEIGVGRLRSCARWRRLLPKGSIFWVTGYRAKVTPRRVALAKKWGASGLASYKRWVDGTAVRCAHEKGLELYVWTIDKKRELIRFRKLGVDGIMSEV